VVTRNEAAAATRRALLDEAGVLLDAGGPAAVTLREVGARAGVSRGAPYGHFADKDTLLAGVAAEGWARLADDMRSMRLDSGKSADAALRAALLLIVSVSRRRPHLYRLMFDPALGGPNGMAEEAQPACDEFTRIVAAALGDDRANERAAVLLTAAHGAAGLEASGFLNAPQWRTTADRLVDTLVGIVG
jgi:AcrR family transcriptional regulator